VLSLDAILTWLLVVTLHLALTTGPTCSTCGNVYISSTLIQRTSGCKEETKISCYASLIIPRAFTISNFAVGVNDAAGFLRSQLVNLPEILGLF
jgi:hypothetical protein